MFLLKVTVTGSVLSLNIFGVCLCLLSSERGEELNLGTETHFIGGL